MPAVEKYPWRVGILDARGAVVGAGVLLSGRRVLTCAHVVTNDDTREPLREIGVEFVGRPAQPPGVARVLENCWFPADDGECGDIALLELDQAVPEAALERPVLRTLSVWWRHVMVQGYPNGNSATAEWARADVVGPGGPRNEWVQLDPHREIGPKVRPGFSGAGVVDQRTDAVIGLVVAAVTGPGSGVAWMMPLDTIVGYLPSLAGQVQGTPAADRDLRGKGEDQVVSDPPGKDPNEEVADLLRVIAGWLEPDARGVVANIVGPADGVRSAALAAAVALSDPVSRRQLPGDVVSSLPPDTTLPLGSIDLAVDAAGLTTAQLVGRLARRFGIEGDPDDTGFVAEVVATAAKMSVLVDSADDAAAPDSLAHDVLDPLIAQVPVAGGRLVLGSRRRLIRERGVDVHYVGGSLDERVDRLEATITEVGTTERAARRLYRETSCRIAGAPQPPQQSSELRATFITLRSNGAESADLAGAERAAARALRKAERALRSLEPLVGQRDELRRLLGAYKTLVPPRLAEDGKLTDLYSIAKNLLWKAPCDLAAAQAAVDAYIDEVRRRRDDPSDEEG